MLDNRHKLASRMVEIIRRKDEAKRNLMGDDTNSSFGFETTASSTIKHGIRIIQKNLPEGFIMDHPVYSDLNNSEYVFNKDYEYVPGTLSFTISLPAVFSGGQTSTTLLYDDTGDM